MDTQFNLPFQFEFIQNYSHLIPTFVQELSDEEPSVQLKENLKLEVLFWSQDRDARLYMEGLELLPSRFLLHDDNGNPYLEPRQTPYTLFESFGEHEDYPLIPGGYCITIECQGKQYQSMYQIEPKEMNRAQWEIMKDELENELRGLAQDLIRKRFTVGTTDNLNRLPAEQLYKFLVIVKYFPKLLPALSDISQRYHSRIQKQYRVVPIEKARELDDVGIRYESTNPLSEQQAKVAVRTVDVNLAENRWVKKIVIEIGNVLNGVLAALVRSLDSVTAEIVEMSRYKRESAILREKKRVQQDLEKFVTVAKKVRHSLQVIENAHWYEEVTNYGHIPFAPALVYDARYRVLYELYRELRAESASIRLDTSYAYQWKRTDWLYEMWGFLQFCKMLIHVGYTPIDGWLFGADHDVDGLFIPMLRQGTQVVFQNGNITVRLVYNGELASNANDTDLHHPLYIMGSSHNKPDARIDVFQNDVYQGSLIIDFKYRPVWNIWDVHKPYEKRKDATNQLLSYYSAPASKYLGGDNIPEVRRSQWRPVHEVWAMYPKDRNQDEVNKLDRDHHVRLLTLCPGKSIAHIQNQLEHTIDRIVEWASAL